MLCGFFCCCLVIHFSDSKIFIKDDSIFFVFKKMEISKKLASFKKFEG